MRYTDFVLLAREPRIVKAKGKKRLTFGLLAPGLFNDPVPRELDVIAVGDLKDKAGGPEGPDFDWKDARRLGEALGAALLPDEVWNALNNRITQAAAAQEGVRVRLMLSGSELNNWPWEFTVFNRAGGEIKISDFLALMPNVSLVRHAATPLPAWRVEAKVPAKVLIAVASPSGGAWPKLAVEDERRTIEKAVEGSAQLSVASVEHARRSHLPDKLHPAHVFHFAGHGKFDRKLSPIPGAYEGKASIVLEDEVGNEDSLDAVLLAVQLRDAGVRVAVLGACQTAESDDLGAWSSVAEALLKAELGAVVGMQFSIRDTAALCFAQRFYSALAVGLSIDEAVAAGRVAVACSGDARGWATPVLYLRSPDGVLFPEFGAASALADERERIRSGILQDIGVLEGSATVLKIGKVELDTSDAGNAIRDIAQSLDAVSVNQKIKRVAKTGSAVAVEVGVVKRSGRRAASDRAGSRTKPEGERPERLPDERVSKSLVRRATTPRTLSGEPERSGAPSQRVHSKVSVGTVTGGQVIGTQIKKLLSQQFVDARTIVNIGPEGVRAIAEALMTRQAIDPTSVQAVTTLSAPKPVSRQIAAVVTAQRKLAAAGAALDAETAYRLGMLAAYKRDYDVALDYFRKAVQADKDYRSAFAALSWLQQSRAMSDLQAHDYDSAAARLAEAGEAALHTDPLSASDLAQRGYVYKTLAQVAESRRQKSKCRKYYEEAGRLFEQAAKLDPKDASAQNGMGNVLDARGDLDGAIAAYRRAIKLAPDYTAAHHDLAAAFEEKAKAEPSGAKAWLKRALRAWQEAYRLAPNDPLFSADQVLEMGQRIEWLRSRATTRSV